MLAGRIHDSMTTITFIWLLVTDYFSIAGFTRSLPLVLVSQVCVCHWTSNYSLFLIKDMKCSCQSLILLQMLTSKNFSFESPIKSLSTAPIFNNDDSQSSTISTSSEVTRLSTSLFINNNILSISYASYIALIQNTLWCHRSELKIANKTYVPGWQTAKRDDVRELNRLHLQVCQTRQACHRPRSVLVHCQAEERGW